MRTPVLAALLLAGATALPVAAQAQQRIIVEEGVTTGLSGPGVGIISEDVVPSFRRYVVEERIPSYTVDAPVRAPAAALPPPACRRCSDLPCASLRLIGVILPQGSETVLDPCQPTFSKWPAA